MTKPKKVALACSGGLDASVIISRLAESYCCEVVAICTASLTTGSSYHKDAFAFNLMSATSTINRNAVNAGTSK